MYLEGIAWINENVSIKHLPQSLACSKKKKKATANISSANKYNKIALTFALCAAAAAGKSLQSCPTLCDPIDGSPPGSPISGIFQAITREWVGISFSNT